MIEAVTQDKVTVLEAAKALNIARKTIYRWIERGLLSKVKEGNKTYVYLEDVKALCDKVMSQTDTKFESENVSDTKIDTKLVTLERAHYEGLLIKLGQFEAERRYLLEYKEDIEEKNNELLEQKAVIEQKNKEIAKLQAIEKKAEELEKEIQRLKRPFWKRIFSK